MGVLGFKCITPLLHLSNTPFPQWTCSSGAGARGFSLSNESTWTIRFSILRHASPSFGRAGCLHRLAGAHGLIQQVKVQKSQRERDDDERNQDSRRDALLAEAIPGKAVTRN